MSGSSSSSSSSDNKIDEDDGVFPNPPMSEWPGGKKLIVYHVNWAMYGKNYQVAHLPIHLLSDVNYAFFDLRQSSGNSHNWVPTSADAWADTDKRFTEPGLAVPPLDSWNDPPGRFYGNFGQFRKLRANGHKFNLGLSIGGWTWSKHFSSAVLTHEARAAFVATVLRIFDTYPGVFNRVDLDWEHISPPGKNYGEAGNEVRAEDPANFAAFLRLLRETLDATGRHHFEISACVVADPEKMVALPIQAMVQYLTTLNVMTYDFASSAWGPTPTAHNSNLRSTPYARLSVTLAVDHLLSLGVPANKIVIGAVLYSRGFANTDGIGHPSHGRVPGGSGNDDGGVLMYSELPPAGAAELYDAAAGAGYAYDAVRRVLWSYDTVESAREKCRFVWERGLRGVIVWESSGDVRDWNSPRSVLRALSDGLREPPAP